MLVVQLVFAFAFLFIFPVVTTEAQCDLPSFSSGVSLGAIPSEDITEASGLAASWRNPGVLWTHNDGSREKIFALSTRGVLLATFRLGKSVDDVEDIAVGPGPDPQASYLYAGDIGSNNANRDEVQILRVAEPDVTAESAGKTFDFQQVETFRLKYAHGQFDAEGLLIDPLRRELFVLTKEDSGSHVFRISLDALNSGSRGTLEEVAQLGFSKVSGGAVSRDGSWIAIRREDQAHLWVRTAGQDLLDALRGPGTVLPVVGPPQEPNGEGIAFLSDNSGYVTISEGKSQPLYFFQRSTATGQPLFVGNPVRTPSGLELRVSGCNGTRISLLRSADLRDWVSVASFASTGEVHAFVIENPAEHAFYRLSSE